MILYISIAIFRFPLGTGVGEPLDVSVLCIPIVLISNDVIAVAEFTRGHKSFPFSEVDLQLAHAIFGWMVAFIHENDLKRVLTTQQNLNDFLLETTRSEPPHCSTFVL